MASKGGINGLTTAYPRQAPPRRLPIIFTAITIVLLIIILSTSSSVPSASELSTSAKNAAKKIHRPNIHRPTLPNIKVPWGAATHEPPVQRNSTSGESKWFSDFKWLNPFSSSITLDENRSVLPPLPIRPPIYTFYDIEIEEDDETRAAKTILLLIWRRAWWAQGFQPVILGRAEAMSNPIYERLQVRHKKLDSALEAEIMRWLAWGHMGSGILANWLVLPMGPRDDHLLSYLRRGQYPRLTRYEGLGNGLFSGDQASIDAALSVTLSTGNLATAKTFLEAIADPDIFSVDHKPEGIAFYETSTITSSYKAVADAILTKQSSGLRQLAKLISSHLHITFLNTFKDGLAVLTPHPGYSTILASPGLTLATALTTCPDSPLPDSCPPNNKRCIPCSSSSPLPVTFPTTYTNTSTLFTIGNTPHPYTLATFLARKPDITTRHIRRETDRDPWLTSITREMLGKDIGGPARIVGFKEAVASEWGYAHGLWSTGERDYDFKDLEWRLGFALPKQNKTSDGADKPPDTIVSLRPLLQTMTTLTPKPSPADLDLQTTLLANAKQALGKTEKGKSQKVGIKGVVEAWNLADTEAWRFVRAFEARSRMERLKWEEDERKFAGGSEGEGRGEGWGRWFDRS